MNVGYRSPPKHSRFKKGRSGNPTGRPRQAARRLSTTELFSKVAHEEIAIEVESRQLRMTRWEALVRQIQAMALKKNASAARLLNQMRKQFPSIGAEDRVILVISDADTRL